MIDCEARQSAFALIATKNNDESCKTNDQDNEQENKNDKEVDSNENNNKESENSKETSSNENNKSTNDKDNSENKCNSEQIDPVLDREIKKNQRANQYCEAEFLSYLMNFYGKRHYPSVFMFAGAISPQIFLVDQASGSSLDTFYVDKLGRPESLIIQ